MDKLQMRCPYCQVKLEFAAAHQGQTGTCPKCQMDILFQGQEVAPAAPTPPSSGGPLWDPPSSPFSPPPPPPLPEQPPASGPRYPERMKANKALAGRVCPGCQKAVDLGDDVFNCQRCLATMHLACHETRGTCAQCHPAVQPAAAAPPAGGVPLLTAQRVGDARPRVPCRFCSELIPAGAAMCSFCHEFQDEGRRALQQMQSLKNSPDEKMNIWEILLCILCALVGCIVGIVYAIQGKKKGGKMILLAIAATVVWTIIQAIIGAASRH